jgi:hypothetical protein
MATNFYFNSYGGLSEQRVIEDLIVESIKVQGFDTYYLPNDNDQARDLLLGEDPVKKFESAFPLEMYLSNSMEYLGEKEFFSKFGLEIRNNVNVIVSRRSFSERVPQNTFTRPREGDLIYIPFLNGTGELFEIKFTNQTKDFFMLGRKVPYFYELELEKYRFSQEVISTGIEDIDSVVTDSAYTIHLHISSGNNINYNIKEFVYQSSDGTANNIFASATVQSWIPSSKTLSVTNIFGEFIANNNIVGSTSGALWSLGNFDPLESPAKKEGYDNITIKGEANTVLVSTEINPIGKI